MELITTLDDERFGLIPVEAHLWAASLRAALEERDQLSVEATDWSEAWKKEADECTVKTTAIANLHDVIKERDSRIKQLEEAVEWVCSDEVFWSLKGTNPSRVYIEFQAELRRRVGEEGGNG